MEPIELQEIPWTKFAGAVFDALLKEYGMNAFKVFIEKYGTPRNWTVEFDMPEYGVSILVKFYTPNGGQHGTTLR